ncbi:LOW QUALITY PROTEIN: hypothetical protein QYF61_021723, partial [Mycteria americana]
MRIITGLENMACEERLKKSRNNPNGNGIAWTSAGIVSACHGLLAVLLGDFPGHSTQSCAAIQRDLNRLEKWAIFRNLMKFCKGICKALHLGTNNPIHQYILGANWLESSFAMLVSKLDMSQKIALQQRGQQLPGLKHIASRPREVTRHLYLALVTPQVQVWAPQVQERSGHTGAGPAKGHE